MKKKKQTLEWRLFELVVEDIVKKAGFETDIQKINSNQFTFSKKLNKKMKRLKGRGGTYDPDIVGVFKMPIPFTYPIMLIGECKHLQKEISPDIAREFLGIYTDVSQFPRTEYHKTLKYSQIFQSARFMYAPVMFSISGFEKNAQSFLYVHGIGFISYENSPIFSELEKLIKKLMNEIRKGKKSKVDLDKINLIDDLESIPQDFKKVNFEKRRRILKKYVEKIKSYIALLDNHFVVHVFAKKIKRIERHRDVNYRIEEKNQTATVYLTKKETGKKIGIFFTLPRSFLKFYKIYNNCPDKKILTKLTLFYEKDGQIYPLYINLNEANQNETRRN